MATTTPSSPVSPSPTATPGPAPQPRATADSDALFGLWRLEAPGERTDTLLRIGGGGLVILRRCSMIKGEWRATTGGVFLGAINRGSASCRHPDGSWLKTPSWLERATTFRVLGPNRRLLDERGNVLATLRAGGPHNPVIVDKLPKPLPGEPPAFRPPRRPTDLAPPSREGLLGTWYPEPSEPGDRPPRDGPRLEVRANGQWFGSDGCNGMGGRWALAPDGELLSTGSLSTLIGCDNDDRPRRFGGTRWVSMDGPVLVLIDAAGQPQGRFIRG